MTVIILSRPSADVDTIPVSSAYSIPQTVLQKRWTTVSSSGSFSSRTTRLDTVVSSSLKRSVMLCRPAAKYTLKSSEDSTHPCRSLSLRLKTISNFCIFGSDRALVEGAYDIGHSLCSIRHVAINTSLSSSRLTVSHAFLELDETHKTADVLCPGTLLESFHHDEEEISYRSTRAEAVPYYPSGRVPQGPQWPLSEAISDYLKRDLLPACGSSALLL